MSHTLNLGAETSVHRPTGLPPPSAGCSSTTSGAAKYNYYATEGQRTPTTSSTSSLLSSGSRQQICTPDSDISFNRASGISGYFDDISGNKYGMNQPTYLSQTSTHLSNAPSYSTHSPTTGEMTQYSQYPQAPSMAAATGPYSHAGYGYYGGVTSPQSATQPSSASMNGQLAPLALVSMNHSQGGYSPTGHGQGAYHHDVHRQQPPSQSQAQSQQPPSQSQPHFDASGQIPPPGVKPRVTATLWEDEGSLCFQVEAKGVCVARREDNHFINGTKLLNVAGMTRGRRDGILKSEKTRHVVKIGPMHLKGVWIPFERALEFANREKITELLYPLFVHNISALLYHPSNNNTTTPRPSSSAEARQRKDSQRALPGSMAMSSGPPSASLQHHHSMNGQVSSQSPITSNQSSNRPEMNRAHTFPTPPASASAILPPQPNSYEWGTQTMSGGVTNQQPLTIETGLHNTRSMPSTPATTPPANSLQSMPSYPNNGTYSNSYATTPHTPNQFQTTQQNIARFGPPMSSHGYVKNDMGPPSRGNTNDVGHGNDAIEHATADDNDQDGDYHRYGSSQAPYNYTPTSTMGSIAGDHSHLPNEQEHSPQGGSGRMTPRNPVSHTSSWKSGYNTPPRTGSGSLNYVMGDSRSSLSNGHSVGDAYGTSAYNLTSTKRGRDEDDEYKTSGGAADSMDLKRRKNNHDGSISGAPVGSYDYQRLRSTVVQGASR